jgi:DNA invertase Pin-like site-specific DNA recombinase
VWPQSLGGPTDESLLKPIIVGTLQPTEPTDTVNAKERERRARISATMKARGIAPGPAARATLAAIRRADSPKTKAVLAALAENRSISERALARELGISGRLIWKIKRSNRDAIHHENGMQMTEAA